MFQSGNPAINDETFLAARRKGGSGVMTVQGAVNRSFLLLALVVIGASFTWQKAVVFEGGSLIIGSAIGGFILAIITCFAQKAAPFTAPLYALCEGVFLGAITTLFEKQYPGVAQQAIVMTFGVAGAMLLAYTLRIVRPTAKFRAGVFAATGGIALVYLVNFVMSFFGSGLSFLHSSGPLGIGVSVVIVIVAALNLVLDFGMIEEGARAEAPKYMEWYAAFALLVTLIWLYLEILRLLSKLRD